MWSLNPKVANHLPSPTLILRVNIISPKINSMTFAVYLYIAIPYLCDTILDGTNIKNGFENVFQKSCQASCKAKYLRKIWPKVFPLLKYLHHRCLRNHPFLRDQKLQHRHQYPSVASYLPDWHHHNRRRHLLHRHFRLRPSNGWNLFLYFVSGNKREKKIFILREDIWREVNLANYQFLITNYQQIFFFKKK